MLDHQLTLAHWRSRVSHGNGLDVHFADFGKNGVGVLQGWCRATAGRLHELDGHIHLAIGRFDDGADVRIHVNAHTCRDHALASARSWAERDFSHDRAWVFVDHQRQFAGFRGMLGWNADGEWS